MFYLYTLQQVLQLQFLIQMQHVMKSSIKSIEEYRHNIKLLKYHLKKQQKINQTLKYKDTKKHKKENIFQNNKIENKSEAYSLFELVNTLNHRMKEMGLVLGDIFRMSDHQYQGQITKEQFMKTVAKLKTNIDENLINEMFYAIDSNMNGMLSTDQYEEFLIAHGGSESKEALIFQRKSAEKFAALLLKKKVKKQDFIKKLLDPAPVIQMRQELKKIGLNINQIMIVMKIWDPSLTGFIKHEIFLKSMQNVKQKEERQIKNQVFEKGVKELCVIFRDRKINPIQIFQASDVDGKEGITLLQLEEGFRKLMPEETTFQIKKWINLININNDKQISKEEFISAIRSFYSLNNINIFNKQYDDAHPKLKKTLEEGIPAEKILNQLAITIEDQGLNKKELFHRIDINHNGFIDKSQLYEGLKELGISIGEIGKILSIFDRDSSEEVSLDQWLNILGQDLQMEDIDLPEQTSPKKQIKAVKKEDKKKQTKKDDTKKLQTKKSQASKQKQVIKNEPLKDHDKNKANNKTMQQKSSLKISENNNKTTKPALKQSVKKQSVKQQQAKKPITKKQSIKQQPKKQITKKQSVKQQAKKQITKKQSVKKIQIVKKQSMKKQQIVKKQSVKKQQKSSLKNSNKKVPAPKKAEIKFEQDQIEQLPQVVSQQQQMVQTEPIQRQIGQIYERSPKSTLSLFDKLSKNKKGMTKAQFSSFLKELKIKAQCNQKQLTALYQENISQNGLLTKQYFEKLVQTYSLTLQQQKQKEQKKQPEKKAQTNNQNKNNKKEILESMIDIDNTLINQQPQKNDYQQQFENQSQIKKTEEKIVSKTDIKQKRGQNAQEFKEVFDHILQNQTYTQEGYKLSSYIKAQDQVKLLTTKYLPQAESLKKNKKLYEDKSFPAKLQSITHERPNKSKINNVTLIKWKHYKQFYKKPELFINSIEPNDIKQGGLGDCYFLCSLAALAQYQKLIERLFEYYDLQNGYFLIWLCIDGQWKLVEIDGYFPVSANDNSKPAFSHSNDEELWVMLLEKAYAKMYGNYQKINGGQPYEAIKDLSGCPGQSFTHRSEKIKANDLWQKLVDANKNHFMMTCGTDQDPNNKNHLGERPEPITTEGIVLGHAYSILDIRQYKKEKLIQLRNPWGQMQWNGDWSDSSKKWTEQAKQQLGYSSFADDGTFWMPFQTFFTRYNTTGINFIRPTYHYKSEVRNKTKSFLIIIEESSFQHGFIMITQADHRKTGQAFDVPYKLTHLLAIQYQDNKVIKEIGNQRYKYQREGSVQIMNSQKNSTILVFVNIQTQADIKICSYTANPLNFKVSEDQRLIQDFSQNVAMNEERIKKIQQQKGSFKFWNTEIGQYCYTVFKNVSKKEMNLTVEYSAPVGIELAQRKNKLKMKTGQCGVISGKILNMQECNFGQMNLQFG